MEVFNLKTNKWRIINKMNHWRYLPGSANFALICFAKKNANIFCSGYFTLLCCENLHVFDKQINAKFHIVYASFRKIHFREKKKFVKYKRKFCKFEIFFAKTLDCKGITEPFLKLFRIINH